MHKRVLITAATLISLFMVESIAAQSFTATGKSIYADHKARGVGDIITVLIVEFSEANNKATTSTSKSDNLSINIAEGTGFLSPIPDAGASSGLSTDYTGAGQTSRQGSLKGKMTATILEILPNGYFRVEGSRLVEVNQDKQVMKITGVVRPRDVKSDNTVFSYNIADAEITYIGEGAINTGHRMGFLRRIINKIF